jgi:hypothetical protein
MKTIYRAKYIFYSFEAGADALFISSSHEADEVLRKSGRLCSEGDPSTGGFHDPREF